MKKCLIIGGGGFVGRNLVEFLSLKGYQIKVIDKYTNNLYQLKNIFLNIELLSLEVDDIENIIAHLEDVENIIWLVHTSVPSTSMNNIESDLTSNLLPLIAFLKRIKSINTIKKFIYLSSGGTIYGEPLKQIPITEDHHKKPISSYGLTKLIAEQYINFILDGANIQRFILRPSNIYGLHQNLNVPQGIIGHTLNAVIHKKPLTLFDNRLFIRDYIFVSDIAEAIAQCLNYKQSEDYNNVFNLGFGQGYSIEDLLDKIYEVTNYELEIKNQPARSFDCTYNVLNIERISSKLEWSPKVNLNEGLMKVWTWMRDSGDIK
jgi:UDP-glucose 4-epimerase